MSPVPIEQELSVIFCCMPLYSNDDQPPIRGSIKTPGSGESDLNTWIVPHCSPGSQCRGSVWKLWYHYHGDPYVSAAPVQKELT